MNTKVIQQVIEICDAANVPLFKYTQITDAVESVILDMTAKDRHLENEKISGITP